MGRKANRRLTCWRLFAVTGLAAMVVLLGACVLRGPGTPTSDPFTLNGAAVTGDVLMVSVSYAGGCRDHEFRLLTADSFMESDPVQLRITIVHDGNGDRCEAWITEQRSFDLSDIKARWQAAYRRESGVVQLRLRDAVDDAALLYRF